jgi:hypothetical protein
MQTITPDTGNIVNIEGALIEYTCEYGVVKLVKVHQPMQVRGAAIHIINEAINEHLGSGYRLIQQPFECIGTIGIKTWKVVYD